MSDMTADANSYHEAEGEFRDIVREELDKPQAMLAVLDRLESQPPSPELWSFLKAKHVHHRASFYLRSENILYRRLGWRLMRPLFILAVLAAVGFALQRKVDPTIGVGLFLGGAAGLFVVLQFFAHRWAWKSMGDLSRIEADYRRSLNGLLGETADGSE